MLFFDNIDFKSLIRIKSYKCMYILFDIYMVFNVLVLYITKLWKLLTQLLKLYVSLKVIFS